MHGACDSVAGGNVLCATVTRTVGDIIGACKDTLSTVMNGDDRKNIIASGDGAAVNNGLYEVTSVTGVNKIASNEMGHQEVEKSKKDANLGNCVKDKQMENS